MKKQLLFLLLAFSICANANVRLPKLFADDMVLQRNKLIPVWGWADANENIEIKFNKQTKTTKADKNGKWIIRLDSENAGGPYELSIKGKNKITIKNVLVGEVWICSGQSNMAFTVDEALNAEKEINDANYPFIRAFTVSRDVSSLPKDDVKEGKWEVCNKSTVVNFTAVGYFFAKKIYAELKIPIGLIHTSWGGTGSETWTSREAFESSDEFKEMIAGMPNVNLDSISKVFNKSIAKRVEELQGSKINPAKAEMFKEFAFNDSAWPELNEPEAWESQDLGEFDGTVWLRKTITLSANDAGKEATIELSKIDDEDITYVNGIEIGRNNNWDAKRKYSIPAAILKDGKNTISIRVVDGGGGGGIYGESDDFKITIGDKIIPLKGKWKYQVEAIKSDVGPNSYPSLLYNAMVNPLIPYAFEGVLWYQGETNAWRAQQYKKAFPLLINDWRKKWNQGDFPFYFVQISSFNETNGNSNNGSMWAELREAQTQTLKLPNTGMCVTTDIGNPTDIHPKNKQDVGKRLAAIALKNVYKQNIVCTGPTFKSMEIQGNKIIVSFENLGSGLSTPDKYGYLKGFEIAGDDKVFHFANAQIVDNKVVIYCENVPNPVALHFGWADDASDNNLYNKEGFPAVPFRTDNWKNVTENVKYKMVK
ncbi:MAG: 9-O-acetylesterase [Lentimicrobium sp.]|jgi:sialate O-acetylesterase|nr:9-O-acetylesterase [Lentimicrobium sp.]